MDKKEAIEFLKKKVREIPNLEKISHKARSVILWRNSIEDVLEAVFGRNSTEFQRFYGTRHKKLRNKEYTQKDYLNQLRIRERSILSIINKWKIIGFEEQPLIKSVPPKAFIAHGGRSGKLDKLREFIEAIGLEPLVVELLPSGGLSVDDKVNKYIKDADCGIVLATKGGIIDTHDNTRKKPLQHPRLNVIAEVERLRANFPNRTILLLEKGVNLPSDLSSLTYEPFVGQSMDRAFTAIARELTAFGILKAIKPSK